MYYFYIAICRPAICIHVAPFMAEPFGSYLSDITVDWHRLKYSNFIELGSRSLPTVDPPRTVSVLSPLTGIKLGSSLILVLPSY